MTYYNQTTNRLIEKSTIVAHAVPPYSVAENRNYRQSKHEKTPNILNTL